MDLGFGKLIEWLKLSPRYLFAVTVACSLLLFLPASTLKNLGLIDIQKSFRPWFGVIWIVCIALMATHGLIAVGLWGKGKLKRYRLLRRGRRRLHNLTSEEKRRLAPYIAKNTRTQLFTYTDGVVLELEVCGIIRRASIISEAFFEFPYNIQPWAWGYLNKHPELVGLPRKYSDDER